MTICISSCSYDEHISIVGSFWCLDSVWFRMLPSSWVKRRIQSSKILDSSLRSEWRNNGYIRNSFSEMNTYFIAILRKYIFKNRYNIASSVWNREYSHIILNLKWDTVWFEPIIAFLRRKFSERLFYKFPATSILSLQDFTITNSGRYITTPTSWKENFFPQCIIFFEKVNMKWCISTFDNGRSCHNTSCSSTDNCNLFHST